MVIKINKTEVLANALKSIAKTHHVTSRYSEHPGLHATSQHWQHCPAISCTSAFNALVTCGIFGEKEQETRYKVQQRVYERLGYDSE